MDPTEARWFALKVGYRKEKIVKKLLEHGGVECFLPLRDRPFRYKSKTGVRQIPLLGGYLFVKIVSAQITTVLQPSYVFGFVRIGRYRKQVTGAEIELLQRLCTNHHLQWEVETQPPELTAGTLVEIARGPLAGVRGHYVEKKNKKTFIISFGGLDARLTTCEVAPDMIIPLKGEIDKGSSTEPQ
jgi:transcription antitermination factor NusG